MFGNKENHKILFMKYSRSIINDLEIRPSRRNEGPTVMMVNDSSKLPLFASGRQFVDGNDQVRGNGIAINEA